MYGDSKVLSECIAEMGMAMSKTPMPQQHRCGKAFPRGWLRGMVKPSFPPSTKVDSVYSKCSPWLSPHPQHGHDLKTATLQRLLLPRLVNPASLFHYILKLVSSAKLYVIPSPPCSIVYNKHAKLLECCGFFIWEPSPSEPSFSVPTFVMSSFPHYLSKGSPLSLAKHCKMAALFSFAIASCAPKLFVTEAFWREMLLNKKNSNAYS